MESTINFITDSKKNCVYGPIPKAYQFRLNGKVVTRIVAKEGILYATHNQATISLAQYSKEKTPCMGSFNSSQSETILTLFNKSNLTWIGLRPLIDEKPVDVETFNLPWLP